MYCTNIFMRKSPGRSPQSRLIPEPEGWCGVADAKISRLRRLLSYSRISPRSRCFAWGLPYHAAAAAFHLAVLFTVLRVGLTISRGFRRFAILFPTVPPRHSQRVEDKRFFRRRENRRSYFFLTIINHYSLTIDNHFWRTIRNHEEQFFRTMRNHEEPWRIDMV